jgi:hypothetical protein
LYVINASSDDVVYVKSNSKNKEYSFTTFNCMGEPTNKGIVNLDKILQIKVPKSGLLHLKEKR